MKPMCLKLTVVKQRIQMYCFPLCFFSPCHPSDLCSWPGSSHWVINLRYELIVECNFWRKWFCYLRIRCPLEGSVVSVLTNLPVFALDIKDENRKWSVKYSFFQKRLKVYFRQNCTILMEQLIHKCYARKPCFPEMV